MSRTTPRTPFTRGRRTPDLSREVTSEQIARDLAAFRSGGGRIERLGTTRVLTRVDETASRVPLPAATPVRMRG